MRQNVKISKDEQYLLQIAAGFLEQMSELEKLREAVRLAEVAQSEHLGGGLGNSKVIHPFAGSQLRA